MDMLIGKYLRSLIFALNAIIVFGINLIPDIELKITLYALFGIVFGFVWVVKGFYSLVEGMIQVAVFGAGMTLIITSYNHALELLTGNDAIILTVLGSLGIIFFYCLLSFEPLVDLVIMFKKHRVK